MNKSISEIITNFIYRYLVVMCISFGVAMVISPIIFSIIFHPFILIAELICLPVGLILIALGIEEWRDVF